MVTRACMAVCVALLVGVVGAGAAGASSNLTKPQYIKQADAICGKAIAQTRALGPAGTMASVASKGPHWLTIDNATLKALHALRAPSANSSAIKVLLAGAQAAVTETANAIKAARAGSAAAFLAHGGQAAKLTKHWQAAARRFGFTTCTHWGD